MNITEESRAHLVGEELQRRINLRNEADWHVRDFCLWIVDYNDPGFVRRVAG